MTNEQVKDILHKAVLLYIDSLSDDEYFTEKQLEVLTANKIIGNALEKQIPKKPIDRFSMTFDCDMGNCPNCKMGINQQMNYCDTCGQAIDWSEE